MATDRGRAVPSVMQPMQPHGYQRTHDAGSGLGGLRTLKSIPNRPIELYELEVGEMDFSDL